jgi:hypothetical protein
VLKAAIENNIKSSTQGSQVRTTRTVCVCGSLSTYMRLVQFPAYFPHRVPMRMQCESSRWRSAEATGMVSQQPLWL